MLLRKSSTSVSPLWHMGCIFLCHILTCGHMLSLECFVSCCSIYFCYCHHWLAESVQTLLNHVCLFSYCFSDFYCLSWFSTFVYLYTVVGKTLTTVIVHIKISSSLMPILGVLVLQITDYWKSRTFRLSWLSDTRVTNMMSREDMIPGETLGNFPWTLSHQIVFLFSFFFQQTQEMVSGWHWLHCFHLFLPAWRGTWIAMMLYSMKWLRWESNIRRSWQSCIKNEERWVILPVL